MKVKLKAKRSRFADLTVGNVYRVIGIEADDFRLMNDEGRPFLYPHGVFTVVDHAEPSDWVSWNGDDGERYAYAREMERPGFFEDYFDGNRKVMAILHAYLHRHLRNGVRKKKRSAA